MSLYTWNTRTFVHFFHIAKIRMNFSSRFIFSYTWNTREIKYVLLFKYYHVKFSISFIFHTPEIHVKVSVIFKCIWKTREM